jgi:heptaprenyl diphosphate synthase
MQTDFYAQISAPLARLEEGLVAALDTRELPMGEISNHLMRSRGKRIRPALFFLTLDFLGVASEEHIPVAVAIELIHTATLVHDDVVDKSEMRRNHSTVNAIWGNSMAVLAGDYLFAKAFRLLTDYGDIRMIREMALLVETMSQGEILQQAECYRTDLTLAQYQQRIAMKTARFFSACTYCAGLAAGIDEPSQTALAAYGYNVGLAFQIIDDMLDFYGDEKITGKPVAGDLRQGILTLPVLHILSVSPQSKDLADRIACRNIDDQLIADIHREIENCNCASFVRNLATGFIQEANNALQQLPTAKSPLMLQQAAHFILNREL